MTNKGKKIVVISIISAIVLALVGGLIWYHVSLNKITYHINDTLIDGGGKNAKIILLGGQSNASGASLDSYLKTNVTKDKYAEYESGYNNVYINYIAGQNASNEFVKCSTKQGELGGYFGPELGIAEKLNELYPNETFFIIKCAWGGTNLHEQWLSPSSKGKTGKEYKAFVAFVENSIDYLKSKNYNVTIEGMCWMQGEADACALETAMDYGEHLENFIKDIRKKFSKYASNNGIAFIDAYIAKTPTFWVYYEHVNNGKTKVAKLSNLNKVIDTSELTSSNEPLGAPDIPHYDSLSEIKLGHLFAEQLSYYIN